MKKIIVIAVLFISTLGIANAQRFCIVDMEYILSNVKEYTQAQQQIDQLAEQWKTEIDTKFKEVENAYAKFQAEQVIMSEQMKAKKIEEIENLERAAKKLQSDRFGPQGDLFKKRQELIKPVQDKVYEQVELYANEKSYEAIFDKSSAGLSVLFVNERIDKSDEILARIKK